MSNTTKHIIISAGDTREFVIYNEPEADYHFVQEEGSTLRVHIVC